MQVAGAQMPMNQGMNQMLELFKMQYLMKLFDGSKGGSGSMLMMFALMAYDHFAKGFPALMAFLWLWVQAKWSGKPLEQPKRELAILPTNQPPPPQKTVQAFIQFERHPEKTADPRIDGVIHHVCTLPDVRSLRYNGVEMIPNFKDSLMIDNDIWFEILNPSQGAPVMTVGATGGKSVTQEPILYRLSCYDHDITWLHKFVEQAMETFEQEKKNKLGSETYYFDQVSTGGDSFRTPLPRGMCMFTKSKFTSNRTLKNVYLRQIEDLQERVEFFMRRRDWYDSKGIPHTLGVVMYGHPGCGKTSTIKAIANETKRHIFNIMLSEIRTKEALKDLFYNDQVHIYENGKMEVLNIPLKHRLYVIEDIDAMDSVVVKRSAEQQKREEQDRIRVQAEMELLKQQQGEAIAKAMMNGKKDAEADKLDLATLLNVLDGVRETPGRIIILSTNYPERLDEALLRPGRFDMMLEFEKHSCAVLQQHIERHYDIQLTIQQTQQIQNRALDHKWTPAEVSQILFRRHTDPDKAIDELVRETPEKLFKFSQMKRAEEPKDLPEATSLEELLKEELLKPEESSAPKNELVQLDKEDSDDEFMGTFSGGMNLTNPDPPSAEQVEAEVKAHKTLFPEQYKDGKYIGIIQLSTIPSVPVTVEDMTYEQLQSDGNDLRTHPNEFLGKNLEKLRNQDESERTIILETHKKNVKEITQEREENLKMMLASTSLYDPELFSPTTLPRGGNNEAADAGLLQHMMQSPMFCDDGTGLCGANEEYLTSLEACFQSFTVASGAGLSATAEYVQRPQKIE